MPDVDPDLLVARGERVHVSPPTRADIDPYRVAMTRSATRIGRWNPVNPQDLVHHLSAQSATHRTFLVRDNATDARGRHGLVGCVNVVNIVEGRFMSATMGYNAFDPYAGRGYFAEGLRLIVDVALRPAPNGLGLHRVEANVRIGNTASAGLLRALGFRRERTIRRMLWLADGLGGRSAWFDHDSYAVTREEWPAPRYAPQDQPTGVLVLGAAVEGTVLTGLARELGAVLLDGVEFDSALRVAASSAAPTLWVAAADADRAVQAVREQGGVAARVDAALSGVTPRAQDVVAAALRLRPYLT